MTADQLIQALSEVLYVLIFISVAILAIRQPTRPRIDKALFFGVSALIVVESRLGAVLGWNNNPLFGLITGALLMTLPYLMLRLVEDFLTVPVWVVRGAEIGLALAVISIFALRPMPLPATLLIVLYFVVLQVYAALAFVRGAQGAGGVTCRRLQAVAAGSLFLGLDLLMVGVQVVLPGEAGLWRSLTSALGLLSGIAYFIGFAPPTGLRRAWQEPELRAFLSRAAHLPRLPDTISILRELAHGAATSVGVPNATIGLWDEDSHALKFLDGDTLQPLPPGRWVVQEVFDRQAPMFVENASRSNPEHAAAYLQSGAMTILAAPITAGERRLGVLSVYAPRAPLFADSDLELVQLLADQAAVVLESRALIDEATRVQAREEATRLKDDFLSAAAHDLKTPLTTILAQAQVMERQAQRKPDAPADRAGITRIVREAKRLNRLIYDLLDASRVEQGMLVGSREPVDLVAVAREVCEGQTSERHHCQVRGNESVVGEYDRVRIMQLIENLVSNAVKYSPDGGDVTVRVWRQQGEAHLTVTDEGIGLRPADVPTLFNRFQRGTNVDDRRFAGMGLGLFICRGIVEQHGGHIEASSPGPGRGSTFHVELPLAVLETQHE